MAPAFKKIYLEIGNVCNLQCTFCPEVGREKLRLEARELRERLLAVKPYAERVCFHLMGEPLAHPEFPAFVGIAGEVGVPLEITSNGTLLNERTEEALLHPTVSQVNFSLQSFSDNFPGANPKAYLARIFRFCRRALEERADLYLNLRLWNLGEQEQRDERNASLLQAIEEAFSVTINRRVDPRLRKSKNLKGRLYLHYDTRFDWPDAAAPVLRTKGTCQGTRTHIGVHADGTVVPCCLDKEAGIPLGRLSEKPLEEILAGTRFQAIRSGFERGELVEDLCRRCTYAERFD